MTDDNNWNIVNNFTFKNIKKSHWNYSFYITNTKIKQFVVQHFLNNMVKKTYFGTLISLTCDDEIIKFLAVFNEIKNQFISFDLKKEFKHPLEIHNQYGKLSEHFLKYIKNQHFNLKEFNLFKETLKAKKKNVIKPKSSNLLINAPQSKFHIREDKNLIELFYKTIEKSWLYNFKKTFLDLALKSICLVEHKKDDYSIVGVCRLGGLPDLPSNMTYPTYTFNDMHLDENNSLFGYEFIAQLECSKLTRFQEYLPREGMLYFFINHHTYEAKIIYQKNISDIKTAKNINLGNFIFFDGRNYSKQQRTIPYQINPQALISLPNVDDSFILYTDNKDLLDYCDDLTVEQILEYENIQNQLGAIENASQYFGINDFLYDSVDLIKERVSSLKKEYKTNQYCCLLKIAYENKSGFLIGKDISFVITYDDLLNENFNHVFII
jgi:hypothetical protein